MQYTVGTMVFGSNERNNSAVKLLNQNMRNNSAFFLTEKENYRKILLDFEDAVVCSFINFGFLEFYLGFPGRR